MSNSQILSTSLKRAIKLVGLEGPAKRARREVMRTWLDHKPPLYHGTRLTPRRFINYQIVRYQHEHGHTKLWGSPLVLTIEPTNGCNLRCPHCFTGMGEVGRAKSMLDLAMFRKVMDELSGSLLHLEFYNWGEPLLHKQLPEMIRLASDRGISTTISTNFSIKMDEDRAEAIVRSGLHVLGVSLDGAKQESYEQYRVRGDFARVIDNVRLINEAKRKFGVKGPEIIWEFHIFKHNKDEIEEARAIAESLDMTFVPTKGWVSGPDWDQAGEFDFPYIDPGSHCTFLWQRAVIHNDGGVAPCCSTFYEEDDFGSLTPRVGATTLETTSFRKLWNNASFREARGLFTNRANASDSAKKLVCYDCPITLLVENRRTQVAPEMLAEAMRENSMINYFLNRKPARATTKATPRSGDLIPLMDAPSELPEAATERIPSVPTP